MHLLAPFHGVGKNGVKGKTETEFQKNLKFSDKVFTAVRSCAFKLLQERHNFIPLDIKIEIGKGKVDFEEVQQIAKQVIESFLKTRGEKT